MISLVTNSIPTVQTTNKTIQYVEAVCGAGKTEALIDKVINCTQKYVIAVSTITNGFVLQNRIKDSVFVYSTKKDFENPHKNLGYIYEQTEVAVKDDARVIIMANQSLPYLTARAYLLNDYHLIVDELTSNLLKSFTVQLADEDLKHIEPYLSLGKRHCVKQHGELFELNDRLGEQFKPLAVFTDELNQIIANVSEGYPAVAKVKDGAIDQILTMYVDGEYLSVLDSFLSLTVMSATVVGSLNYTLLYALGYKFEDADWSIKSKHKQFEGDVIVIQMEDITRTKLDKVIESEDLEVFGLDQRVEDLIQAEVLKKIGSSAVWFFNKKRIDKPAKYVDLIDLEHKVVTVDQRGSNDYRKIDEAVCLFSINPNPTEGFMLGLLAESFESLDISKGKLEKSWSVTNYLEPIYQNCLRTSFRNAGEASVNRFVVPDMRAYEYLLSKIPSLPEPLILFPNGYDVVDLRLGNSGTTPKYTPMQVAEIVELYHEGYSNAEIDEKLDEVKLNKIQSVLAPYRKEYRRLKKLEKLAA